MCVFGKNGSIMNIILVSKLIGLSSTFYEIWTFNGKNNTKMINDKQYSGHILVDK